MEDEKYWYGKKHFTRAWERIKEDFRHPVFIFLLFVVIGVYVWLHYFQSNEKIKQAAQAGFIAFIIGYLARLDLVFLGALFVFLLVLFSKNNSGTIILRDIQI